MKKILFIIWSHSFGGGAEALLTTIVNHLNSRKYETGIIEIYNAGIKKEPVNPNIKVYDSITWAGDPEYRKKIYYIYNDPDEMIRRYIPSGYDLYISFNYQLPSCLLPAGTRNIAWIHGAVYDLAGKGMEPYRQLQDRMFEKAAKIISISDVTTQSLRELFPDHANKITEVYNSVNVKEIREKAWQHVGITLKRPAVISVGRLDDNKNPLRMVEIFRHLYQRENNVSLYFLGKGELEAEVKERVREYGLQERVHFLGYVENPFPVIQQADVCCMTSKSEGFPMSLLESVALGVPFVSTEVGGSRILARQGYCGKVYRTDEEAVNSILELLHAPKDLLVEECNKVIGLFDLDTYICRIESLLDEVLASKIAADERAVWNYGQAAGRLEDKSYYYRFPDGVIEKGSKVVLYGAGDIGSSYHQYMKERGLWDLTAWVDAAAERYRDMGKDVQDIDIIMRAEYDIVLIAVMAESTAESIRKDLCGRGIPEDKILWTVPIF